MLFFMQNANERSQTCWVVHKNESIVSQKEIEQIRVHAHSGKIRMGHFEELQMDYERIKNEQRERSMRERVNRLDELLPYPIHISSPSALHPMPKHPTININW